MRAGTNADRWRLFLRTNRRGSAPCTAVSRTPIPHRHPAIMRTSKSGELDQWPQALNPSADGAARPSALRGGRPGGRLRRQSGSGPCWAELGRRAPRLTPLGRQPSGLVPRPGRPRPGVAQRGARPDDDPAWRRVFALALEARLRSSLRTGDQHRRLLHQQRLQPEKRPAPGERQALEQLFAVNAYGPLLLAKAKSSRC